MCVMLQSVKLLSTIQNVENNSSVKQFVTRYTLGVLHSEAVGLHAEVINKYLQFKNKHFDTSP